MKLSQFDLSWYAQWGMEHRPLEEWSRPGLTNFLGSLQASADPTSIRHVLFPPVSGSEESTCYLTLNGAFLSSSLVPTTVRWTPWAITRSTQREHWQIESRLSMVAGEQAVLQAITLTNQSDTAQPLELGVRLSGRCVNRGKEPWFWGIPIVALSVTDLHDQGGMYPTITPIGNCGRLFRENPNPSAAPGTPLSHAGEAYNAQALHPAPDRWARNGDAMYQATVAPGECFTLHFALAMEPTVAAADTVQAVLSDPQARFDAIEQQWQDLWQSAFSQGGALSGQLADTDLPEALAPVAASAILTALTNRRTFRANEGRPTYSISMPRRVEACVYPNDWSLAGHLLARMDTAQTWKQLEIILRADIRSNNQINLLTNQGGDFSGHAWPYTIDIFNCFYTAWNLWQVEGATPEMLTEKALETNKGRCTLLEIFEDLAFDWRSRKLDALGLADYGPKAELLECVSTYAHVVAALNAGAIWMLNRQSDIYTALGRDDDAAAIRAEAEALLQALLRHLYVEGEGYFCCIDADGKTKTEVRHCWDFGMVGYCIGDQLPDSVKAEMITFFQRELQTPGWVRALSPHDADAAVSGIRADHQYNGAFGAWPAQCVLALVRMGRKDLAREWMDGFARTARQGPFGQAHYDEGVYPSTHGGATKVTEELPQCCHWSNISGGLFYEAVLETFA